jgi:hypothetical protein
MVGQDAGRQTQDEIRNRAQEADQGERGRGAAEQEDDVAEGGRLDPVSCQRQQDAGRITAVMAVSERSCRGFPGRAPFRDGGDLRDRPAEEAEDSPANGICVQPSILQPVRHTDARRLAQSGADEKDRPVARKVGKARGHLVGRDANGAVEPKLLFLVAANVDEERTFGHSLTRVVGVDSQGRTA